MFIHFRYFQGIPTDNPSVRHIYSVKDDRANSAISNKDSVNAPRCLTCQLPDDIKSTCTYSEALFSNRSVNIKICDMRFVLVLSNILLYHDISDSFTSFSLF